MQELGRNDSCGRGKFIFYHIKKLAEIRKENKGVGKGLYELINTDPGHIFAIYYVEAGQKILIIHNLSKDPSSVSLLDSRFSDLHEFYSDGRYANKGKFSKISINGYGYRWFKVSNGD